MSLATIQSLDFQWAPSRYDKRVEEVCESWKGTRYMEGQHSKQVAVDCVHAVCSILDEMYGYSRAPGLKKLRGDAALHTEEGSRKAMRAILAVYSAHEDVLDRSLHAGDIIVVGPSNGGPGHVMIAGGRRGVLWHATSSTGFTNTGYGISHDEKLFAVYRPTDKVLWKLGG